jgi:hypothetical protein
VIIEWCRTLGMSAGDLLQRIESEVGGAESRGLSAADAIDRESRMEDELFRRCASALTLTPDELAGLLEDAADASHAAWRWLRERAEIERSMDRRARVAREENR